MPDHHKPLPPSLTKNRSWSQLPSRAHANDSPDRLREDAWRKRKGSIKLRSNRKSVTDEDLDELKACIELGFGFDSPTHNEVPDQRLAETFPALELLYAVNKQYTYTVSKSANATPLSVATPVSSSAASDCDSLSPAGSPLAIFGPVENPKTMKTRLRQWAQVVGCSVKQTPNK